MHVVPFVLIYSVKESLCHRDKTSLLGRPDAGSNNGHLNEGALLCPLRGTICMLQGQRVTKHPDFLWEILN